jgi:hypothetical protein
MGNHDPIEMVNFETGPIPFKHASLNLADWDCNIPDVVNLNPSH